MLISHKYKFIFIKTRKTAGTSLEVDLSKLMGENDVVTKIYPLEEGHLARNFILNNVEIYNHMSGSKLKNLLDNSIFENYFKFTIEREPVDKCVSYYSMLLNSTEHNKNTKELTWDQFVENRIFPIDHQLYTDNDGKLLVDKILKYENLKSDWEFLLKKFNIKYTPLASSSKSGFRTNPFITDIQREIIYKEFNTSNKYTGYKLY